MTRPTAEQYEKMLRMKIDDWLDACKEIDALKAERDHYIQNSVTGCELLVTWINRYGQLKSQLEEAKEALIKIRDTKINFYDKIEFFSLCRIASECLEKLGKDKE